MIYFSCESEDFWGNWGVSLCSAAQVSESERVGEDQGIMQELLWYGRHPPGILPVALHGSCVHHSARYPISLVAFIVSIAIPFLSAL